MLKRLAVYFAILVLASLGLAQVKVTDRWRYTPFAQKDAITAERLMRYTFAADGQRLRFEVWVDGQVVSRFVRRSHGNMDFVFRLEPKPFRASGLVVTSSTVLLKREPEFDVLAKTTKRQATKTTTQTYVYQPEGTDVIARTEVRQGDQIITKTQVSDQKPGTLVDVAIELPFAGIDAPASLNPRLAVSHELQAGRSYELLAGHWGEGHELAVYVTPLAD